jgi:uncharacterized protein YuzE
MIVGTAQWSYDPVAKAWYIKLDERAAPPYLNNKCIQAVLDLDSQGRLAGIEILEAIEPPISTQETKDA